MLSHASLKKVVAVGALFAFCFLGISLFSLPSAAHAATFPEFIITWKTSGSYIPSFYQGKALPSYGASIVASVSLVSASGKIINISGQTIYWYLNDSLIGGGTGVQSVSFPPVGLAPNVMTLKVTLPNYPSGYLVHAVQVPMVLPQAVIYAPFPDGTFSENPLTLTAFPYFFTTGDPSTLSYSWSVNSQSGANAENPNVATITFPPQTPAGTAFNVALKIENPNDSTAGNATANLTYQNQL